MPKLHKPHRSETTGNTLLPATVRARREHILVALGTLPFRTFLMWTFGRSTVIWRIWPAVMFHTCFAALIVTISLRTSYKLGIPSVLLTLLGMVLGFVISYRTMSGYDRYWQGRTSWSDVMRTSRTMGRLVWYHTPLRFGPAQKKDDSVKLDSAEAGKEKEQEKEREMRRAMAEKKIALELIEAFAVALKHHLRGETGIYYEDLYFLVKPLHTHSHIQNKTPMVTEEPEEVPTETDLLLNIPADPVIPPLNGYGTASARTALKRKHVHHASLASYRSIASSGESSVIDSHHQPLLPSANPVHRGLMGHVSGDLIPFSGVVGNVAGLLGHKKNADLETGVAIRDRQRTAWTHMKHRPKLAGEGNNVPLQIIRCLTSWLSALEERQSVPGTTMGGLFNSLNQFEDSLASLEKILTTPLPFVFSVHLSTVWLYLFALPFQLVDLFGWYTIPGVGIASFIYLGFVATGEEIEQPFGYDENDLDLDMFCQDVIIADLDQLKKTPCRNAYFGSDAHTDVEFDPTGEHGRVEEVFGYFED